MNKETIKVLFWYNKLVDMATNSCIMVPLTEEVYIL